MMHYAASPQERQQLNGGRYCSESAPLCGTGDGHWQGTHPDHWNGKGPGVTCPRCITARHKLAPRERNRQDWGDNGVRVAVLSLA